MRVSQQWGKHRTKIQWSSLPLVLWNDKVVDLMLVAISDDVDWLNRPKMPSLHANRSKFGAKEVNLILPWVFKNIQKLSSTLFVVDQHLNKITFFKGTHTSTIRWLNFTLFPAWGNSEKHFVTELTYYFALIFSLKHSCGHL